MEDKELVKLAIEAMKYAYSPYSNYTVGAALLADNGKVYTGCNIECASFGGTNCAERTALFKAVSEGVTKFVKIAVVGGTPELTYPCGICRQVLAEFALNIEVIVANKFGDYKVHKLTDLIPYTFTKEDLDK